jgi:hypothetical protein
MPRVMVQETQPCWIQHLGVSLRLLLCTTSATNSQQQGVFSQQIVRRRGTAASPTVKNNVPFKLVLMAFPINVCWGDSKSLQHTRRAALHYEVPDDGPFRSFASACVMQHTSQV